MLAELVEISRKRKRIITLDIMRGFFLFIIIIDHINRFPNGFDLFTGRGILWFSAAEGFIAISGMLIGYIYGPKMAINPKETAKRLFKRALTIYLCVISLSFFFMAYTFAIAAIPNSTLDFVAKYQGDIPALLFDSVTLQYVFGWGEFLSHYVFYLLASPLLLYALIKKKAVLLIGVSIAIWALAFSPFEARNRLDFTLSWQLLFVLGTVIGYYLPVISIWAHKAISKSRRKLIRKYTLIGAVITYTASLYLTWGYQYVARIPLLQETVATLQAHWNVFFTNTIFASLVDKTSLGPLRIVVGTIIFWVLFVLISDYQDRIPRPLYNFFRILGEKSLFVYSLQAVVVFFIGLYIAYPTSFKEIPVLHTGVCIIALLFIYQITKNTGRFRKTYESNVAKLRAHYR